MKKTSITKRLIALLLMAAMLLTLTGCTTGKYEKAGKLIAQGNYEKAAQIYSDLGTYEDAASLALYAKAADAGEKGNFSACLAGFTNLGDFKDSPLRLNYYTARQYEAEAAAYGASYAYQACESYIAAADIYAALPLYLDADTRYSACIQALYDMPAKLAAGEYYSTASDIMTGFVDYMTGERGGLGTYIDAPVWAEYYTARQYEANAAACAAEDAFEACGYYAMAANIYHTQPQHQDAAARDAACIQAIYDTPAALAAAGQYDDAADLMSDFANYMLSEREELGIYTDAPNWVDYYTACAAEAEGKLSDAAKGFAALGEFSDAAQRAEVAYQAVYAAAETALADNDPYTAYETFTSIAEYSDSGERAKESMYAYGEMLLNADPPEYAEAKVAYAEAGDYSDAATRYAMRCYEIGEAYLTADEPDYEAAKTAFTEAGDYSDAAERIKECWYLIGDAQLNATKPDYKAAKTAFENAGDYSDASTRYAAYWYAQGEAYLAAEAPDYEAAKAAFTEAGEYSDAVNRIKECWYLIGEAYLNAEEPDYANAKAAFENAGDYSDAATRYAVRCYELGEAYLAAEAPDYEAAKAAFTEAGEYSDAVNRIKECWYLIGEAYLNAEEPDYANAKAAFENAGDYSDAATRYAVRCYELGEAYLAAEAPDYEAAKAAFTEAGDYSDAAEYVAYGCDYQKAQDLMAAGDYASAYSIYLTLKGYKDVDTLLATDENLKAAAAARDAKFVVGNYVTFGSYPQTAAGTDDTPIEWLVLARDGNKALLISRYGLDCQQYHEDRESITWENCTLRTWLNDTFINKAFSAQEQTGILTTHVKAHENLWYSTNPGNDTQDKVFLLSITEAEKYFQSDAARECKPTAYAVEQGARESSAGNCWWWLRSPGSHQYGATDVSGVGSLYRSGHYVNDDYAVRPALWIDLDSGIF